MQIDRILGNVGVLYVGAYNSSIQYEYLNCVTYNGSSYVCVNQNGVTGVEPGTTDDWQLSAKKGDVGPVGPKPINGVDYNTDEEKEEFKNDVVSKATEEVEKNVADIENEAIENYNKNATQKTTEYNTNANTQVESFNANATSKTNDFNSNATTKTNEFNAVVDAEKEQFAVQTEAINHHIAVVSDELERVKNDVLEMGEESGSYITLNDSAMAEYQELSVEGVCEQETTTGKNLFKSIASSTKNGITFTNNGDGSYTINGTATAAISFYITNVGYGAGTYTLSANNTVALNDSSYLQLETSGGNKQLSLLMTNVKKTVTVEDINALTVVIGNGTVCNNFVIKPQLELGSEATSYESYTGGQPSPNPDYPQKIKTIENSLKITSCNKNLFDKDNSILMNKYYTSNGNIQDSENAFIQEKYIEVEPNTNYTFSASFEIDYFRMVEYDESKNFIERKVVSNPVLKTTYTTTNNTKYIRVSCFNNNLDTLQIEKGTQETPYEQHLETQIEANLPEGEFIGKLDDTYKDTLEVEYNQEDGQYHLVLNKRVGRKVLNGSENNIILQSINSYGIANFLISHNLNSFDGVDKSLCDKFKNQSTEISKTTSEGYLWKKNAVYFRINQEKANDVATFKQWLSTHNTELYYALANPYVVDLGVVDQLITYNEITNLFTDSDLMPTINAKYYRNFITTIQNLQVNEKALKEELVDINSRLSALESATTNVASESEVVE